VGDYGVHRLKFPFESLASVALLIPLVFMAATSHDFWLSAFCLRPGLESAAYGCPLLRGLCAPQCAMFALGTAAFDKSGGFLIALTLGAVSLSALHFGRLW